MHPNQIQEADRIVCDFEETPYVVLLAQMQGGKTGTYLHTAFKMMNLGRVEHVYILSGSADKSLKEQAYTDLSEALGALPLALRPKSKNIHILFSNDLGSATRIPDNTLLIHDECHMAQSKDNRPFKFYKKNGIHKALSGAFGTLHERNILILGVSATPFSEITSNQKVLNDDWSPSEKEILQERLNPESKKIHPMIHGAGYIGVSEFLANGNIRFESQPIKSHACIHIARVLHDPAERYAGTYCVIRTATKNQEVIETLATEHGYDYKSVFGDSTESLAFMETCPRTKTIIHICGRFRMGQVIPKEHIGMVYEQSEKPNADTVLQGLVGRMCGYHANLTVDIYVPPSSESSIRTYADSWERNEPARLTGITKAMNLTKGRSSIQEIVQSDKDGNRWIHTVPVKFTLRDIERGFGGIPTSHTLDLHDILNALQDDDGHPTPLLQGNPDAHRILASLEEQCGRSPIPHRHSLTAKKFKGALPQLEDAVATNKRLNISTTTLEMNRWHTDGFNAFSVLGDRSDPRKPIFLLGFVRHDTESHPENPPHPLASVEPKCNYGLFEMEHEDESVSESVNGGQLITFPFESSKDTETFRTNLKQAIDRTNPEHPTYIPNCLKSVMSMFDNRSKEYKGILFHKDVFTKESIEEFRRDITRDCHVTLTFKKSRGRQPADYHKFSSISW